MARTGENIYKLKDGRWEARYIISYDEEGKAKYKYLYARNYSEVKAKLLKAQNGVMIVRDVEKHSKNEIYEFWLREWLKSKKSILKNLHIFDTEI